MKPSGYPEQARCEIGRANAVLRSSPRLHRWRKGRGRPQRCRARPLSTWHHNFIISYNFHKTVMAIISVKASWRLWGFWEILSQHAPKAAWEMPEVPEVPFFLLFWAQVAALPRTELSEELLVLPEAKVNALEWLNANLTRLTQAEMLPVAKPGQPVSNKFKQSQKI